MYYDGAYAPFGEVYAQTGTIDVSFTGMNQDTTSNLYDFPAREYGVQGRWPSPDPAGLSAGRPRDPQTWNRYAYVLNGPLDKIDPCGLDCLVAEEGGGEYDDLRDVGEDDCGNMGGIYVDGSVDTSSLGFDNNGILNFNYTDANGNDLSVSFDPTSGLLTDQLGNVLFDANNYPLGDADATYLQQLSGQVYGESMAGLEMDLIITAPETGTALVLNGAAGAEAATTIAANNPGAVVALGDFASGVLRPGSSSTPAGVLGSLVGMAIRLFNTW